MSPFLLFKFVPLLKAIPKKLIFYVVISVGCWMAWEWNELKAYKKGYAVAQQEYLEGSHKLLEEDLRKTTEDLRVATEDRDKRHQIAKELASELSEIKQRSQGYKDEIKKLNSYKKNDDCFVLDAEYYELFKSILSQK